MNCEKCGAVIPDNGVYEFKNKKLCDDCYIDLTIGVPDVHIAVLSPEVQSGRLSDNSLLLRSAANSVARVGKAKISST